MQVTKRVEFDAGHRVPKHGGKCKNLHGHRYVVAVTIEDAIKGDEVDGAGMVVDFGEIKTVLSRLAEMLDHRLLLWKHDPLVLRLKEIGYNMTAVVIMEHTPTAENIAMWFAEEMSNWYGDTLMAVEVWETPNSVARWYR